jgi:hypothetical protein
LDNTWLCWFFVQVIGNMQELIMLIYVQVIGNMQELIMLVFCTSYW